MKKLVIAGMLIASLTVLADCEDASVEAAQEQRITCIESTAYGDIVLDNKTGVLYLAHKGVCVMVDQNGKPLVMGEKE